MTETCNDKSVNVITDVATVVSSADSQALPSIHARLRRLRPRPPTAFQQYLDARGLPRPLWWRQGK
ncbi:hypothetical protein AB0H73_36590 [Streptomyces olivoreticuli]